MSETPIETSKTRTGTRARLVDALANVFEDVAGVEIPPADAAVTFLELGLDSLSLTQVALGLQKAFSVKLTFRQLMEAFPTLDKLAEHMESTMPPDEPASLPAT